MRLITSQAFISALVVAFIFIALVPSGAHAYIDPGTGSYIIQLLVAGLLSSAYLIKIYWRRIKAMFGASVPTLEEDDDDE
jgi:hypothetical protein